MNDKKYISMPALTMMTFTAVWSFANIVNGYATQGLRAIFSWLVIFGFYFIPYVLMVGEMGAAFKNCTGGVSSWIRELSGAKIAFLAGWTYWIVHVPYLAQKPMTVLISLGWAVFQDGAVIKSISPVYLQLATLALFLFCCWFSSKGVTIIKCIGSIAGTSMFIMSLLFVALAVAAPAISNVHTETIVFSWDTFIPALNFDYLTTIAILVFAVGGCEKLSPYVNDMENPSRDFPRAMILLTVMVAITALTGSYALGLMFDTNNVPKDLMMNGAFYSFMKLGEYYNVGPWLMIIYAICNALSLLSTTLLCIDAPIKIFLADVDKSLLPKSLTYINENGVPVNGYKLTAVLVSIIIIYPVLGIGDVNSLYNSMIRLNAICMPLRYLWVFIAYMALKKARFFMVEPDAYQFTSNRSLGFLLGLWCFIFTAFACIMGMFPSNLVTYSNEWLFQLSLNIATPIILLGLGLVVLSMGKHHNA